MYLFFIYYITVVLVRMSSNKLNVVTREFMAQMMATLDALDSQYPNDGVVLTGNGTVFSAGLDIKGMTLLLAKKQFEQFFQYGWKIINPATLFLS